MHFHNARRATMRTPARRSDVHAVLVVHRNQGRGRLEPRPPQRLAGASHDHNRVERMAILDQVLLGGGREHDHAPPRPPGALTSHLLEHDFRAATEDDVTVEPPERGLG